MQRVAVGDQTEASVEIRSDCVPTPSSFRRPRQAINRGSSRDDDGRLRLRMGKRLECCYRVQTVYAVRCPQSTAATEAWDSAMQTSNGSTEIHSPGIRNPERQARERRMEPAKAQRPTNLAPSIAPNRHEGCGKNWVWIHRRR